MQKVLITGANGFLGFYLTRLLLDKGYVVLATGKGEPRHWFSSTAFHYKTLDFTSEESVRKILDEESPDVIVHAGALSKPDFCEVQKGNAFLTNVTGTMYLLKGAERCQAHFIFLSSDFVFLGEWVDAANGFYTEADDRQPVNYYGETKLLAEDAVMHCNTRWSIVRTAMVYGKPVAGGENLVSWVAKALQNGESLTVFHDQVRTPTYVEDLAEGIMKIIEKKSNGIYHLSGEEVWTLYDMAVATSRYLQLDESLIHKIFEGDIPQAARRPKHTCLDSSKAKKEISFSPHHFKEGLSKMFANND